MTKTLGGSRLVLFCLAACGLLSMSIVFLSMEQVRVMQALVGPDLPPINQKHKWRVPPEHRIHGEARSRPAAHPDKSMEQQPHAAESRETDSQDANKSDEETEQTYAENYSNEEEYAVPRTNVVDAESESKGGGADGQASTDLDPVEDEGKESGDIGGVVVADRHHKSSPADQDVSNGSTKEGAVQQNDDIDSELEEVESANIEPFEREKDEEAVIVTIDRRSISDEDSEEEENETSQLGTTSGSNIEDGDSEEEDEEEDNVADGQNKEDFVESDAGDRSHKSASDAKGTALSTKSVTDELKHIHHNHTRPPLNTLIKDTDRGITGHVSNLMDWAIIGHAKTGTTFIMKWLDRHPEIATWDDEMCILFDNRPAGLVERLYNGLPEGHYKRGFKCPAHFSRRAIRYFKRYFSNTRIIVGVRHPVRWFESFYNFRTRHGGANYSLPPPHQLIGACTPEADGVCTDRANFHTNLAVFGKTPMVDAAERNLIRFRKYTYESTYPIDNPLFLYDTAQFYDTDKERMELFKTDLQRFLGLKQPMPEPSAKDAGKSSRPKEKAMDICTPEFDELRKELVQVGIRASMWIRKYFLQSDQVFVSSRDYFEEILKQWKVDPCTLNVTTTTTTAKS
jgi:hypothetical protein